MKRDIAINVMTADLINPDFDGRVHYGAGSVKELKVGDRVAVIIFGEDGEPPESRVSLIGRNNATFTRQAFCREVMANSRIDVPRTWDEFLMVNDQMGNTTVNARILDRLFQSPDTRAIIEKALRDQLILQNQ